MNSRHLLRPRKASLLVGVLLLLALSIGIGVVSAQDGDQAQLRVVHASPDAGDVDVYVDGEVAIEGLAFTDATDFQALDEGDHDIQVTAAGGDVADAVIETSVSLSAGDVLTVVVSGTGEDVSAFEVAHDWDEPGDDMARIVVVNATSDEATVELQYGDGESVGDGAVDAGSSTNGEVEPGDLDFQVLVNDEEATTIDGFTVEAGNTYSIFVMGTDGSYEAVPYEDMAPVTGAPGDETPAAGETPDADTTPEADTTPDADTTPETDTTPEADTTPTTDETPEADSTPATDQTPAVTPSPGTGEGAPQVPATGAGGTAGDSDASGWIALAIAGLAITLGGGLVWRTRSGRTEA